MAVTEDVYVKLKLDSKEFDSSINKSEKNVKDFEGEIENTSKSMAGLTGAFTALGVGALAGAVALTKLTNAMADGVFEADRYANRLGISTKELLNIQSAAKDFGVEAEDVSEGLKNMTERLGEAFLEGKGATFDGLTKLGVDLAYIESLNTEDRFLALAGALSEVDSEAERTFLTMEIFQEEGFKMAEMLNLGEQGLRDYIDAQNDYTDSLDIDSLKEYKKQMNGLNKSASSLGNNLGVLSFGEYAEGLSFMLDSLNEWVASDFKGALFGEQEITVSGFSNADALDRQLEGINKKSRAEQAYQLQLKKNQDELLKTNKISEDALMKEQKLRAQAIRVNSTNRKQEEYQRNELDDLLKRYKEEDTAPELISAEMQDRTLGLLERGSAAEASVKSGEQNKLEMERNKLLKEILAENKKRRRQFEIQQVSL